MKKISSTILLFTLLLSACSGGVVTESAVETLSRAGSNGEVMQVRFRDNTRTALLEWAAMPAPQIEFLIGAFSTNGGAQ